MDYLEKIPNFPLIQVEQPDWQWIDIDKQENILSVIPLSDRYLYLFLALHGCRPSESRALKTKDLDFNQQSIVIRRNFTGKSGNILVEFTKTKKQRIIPMNPEMVDVLKELCKNKLPEAFVFTNPRTNKPYSKTTYQEIWEKACQKVGIRIKSYEALRHSFASQRVSRGVGLYLVSKLLGHTDIRTTQRYAHTNLEALKNAIIIPSISKIDKSQKK